MLQIVNVTADFPVLHNPNRPGLGYRLQCLGGFLLFPSSCCQVDIKSPFSFTGTPKSSSLKGTNRSYLNLKIAWEEMWVFCNAERFPGPTRLVCRVVPRIVRQGFRLNGRDPVYSSSGLLLQQHAAACSKVSRGDSQGLAQGSSTSACQQGFLTPPKPSRTNSGSCTVYS